MKVAQGYNSEWRLAPLWQLPGQRTNRQAFHQCQLSGDCDKEVKCLQMLYCGHFSPQTLSWWMEGLPGGREGEKRREVREEELQAARPGQEIPWGSQPGSAGRLSLLIFLHGTKKFNVSFNVCGCFSWKVQVLFQQVMLTSKHPIGLQ